MSAAAARDAAETALRTALAARAAAAGEDAFTMRSAPRRSSGHGLFQYPAMMLPELQGALLDDVVAADPSVASVVDPFAGSGTVLLEALRRGLKFRGLDVNPLAVLLCAVKARVYDAERLSEAFARALVRARICTAVCGVPAAAAPWFSSAVQAQLGCLRRAVREEPDQDLRRAMWVCLAETIRLTSDSRTSTVKLHRLPKDVIASRAVDALAVFEQVAAKHQLQLAGQSEVLLSAPRGPGRRATATCRVGDARLHRWRGGQADVLMTSPPYGDNRTTVTYGQHSYLPLVWIDHEDIPGEPDPPVNAYSVDRASLGGSLSDALDARDRLSEASPSFEATARQLEDAGRNAQRRLCAFFRDLDESLGPIVAGVRADGWMLWTVGERRIAGTPVPTVAVLRELLVHRGARTVAAVERGIPAGRKRMAPRNGISATMTTETVLVMRARFGA